MSHDRSPDPTRSAFTATTPLFASPLSVYNFGRVLRLFCFLSHGWHPFD